MARGSTLSARLRIAAVAIAGLIPLCGHGSAAGLQNWQWAIAEGLTKEPVIGLLDLPDIVGPECIPGASTRIRLFGSPSTNKPAIGSIEPPRDCRMLARRAASNAEEALPTVESGYETPAAIVYQRAGLWFRIALQQGSAWVERDDSKGFLPYPEILTDRLSYMGKGWDGRVWSTPGASGAATPLPPGWKAYLSQEIPIDLLGTRRMGDEVWIHIRLLIERCGETLQGVSPATGWVRAYQSSGSPSAWFSSRGC
jgi:hypothetical protein